MDIPTGEWKLRKLQKGPRSLPLCFKSESNADVSMGGQTWAPLPMADKAPGEILGDLKQDVRKHVWQGGFEGSGANVAKHVIRMARKALACKGGVTEGEKLVKGGGGVHEGGAASPSYGLVPYVPTSDRLQESGVGAKSDRAGRDSLGGADVGSLGQKLKRLFLKDPNKLEKKYKGCRVGAPNAAGLSLEDKLRE